MERNTRYLYRYLVYCTNIFVMLCFIPIIFLCGGNVNMFD